MRTITLSDDRLSNGVEVLQRRSGGALMRFPASGGALMLPELASCPERYAVFEVEAREEHSVVLNLFVYMKDEPEEKQAFDIRFGVLPGVRALICLDLNWLDAHVLFPGSTPGQLKVVCHGGRVKRENIRRISFENSPCFHDVTLELSDWQLTDERPRVYPLPDVKLVDEFGQYKRREWPGKVLGAEDLKSRLKKAAELLGEYGPDGWDEFGGCASMPLMRGTGFFTRARKDGKWWLVDPLGNAFFSVGPDCVAARADCRVDGVEKFMDWLPNRDDEVYGQMYYRPKWPNEGDKRREFSLFSFEQANLYKAFGGEWYEKWQALIVHQLKQYGMNTIGNWSDDMLFEKAAMPYVTTLPEFPSTRRTIFRDFPDVMSAEYRKNAEKCAVALKERRNDPYMIGYFLRNEPAWAFVDGLVIADEVLFNSEPSACKAALIDALIARYKTPEALSNAWDYAFEGFDALNEPIANASKLSEAANRDLRAFSRVLLEAYVSIPSGACRAADENHMNLGMRWAWISDPDLVTGWENFDVFSINCYAVNPTDALDHVAALGVDLPVMIGEFHFGALDRGLTATGLEGVRTQEDRGKAYRYYADRVAAHKNGVGCHYFQCYDQFALGRFDGENYNLGLFDICSLPHEEMLEAVRTCADGIYAVAREEKEPFAQLPDSIPMIAY